ncbi:MAG: hypothetical protein Q4C64_01060 [Erysipelotrichia bacterium]|nr:hypothetical protein [Erysipelotrichia bacterium]
MAIYDLLSNYVSLRSEKTFNGYLKDYLNRYPNDKNVQKFNNLLNINDEICLYRDFPINIDLSSAANKRIDYRDISKIGNDFACADYIIYWQNEEIQRAIILSEGNIIEARGMFYCLTGKEAPLEKAADELLSLTVDSPELTDFFIQLQNKNCKINSLQRKIDTLYLNDPEHLKDQCIDLAENILQETKKNLPDLPEEGKAELIKRTILRIFLIKKTLYVKYMANQSILNNRHSGNSKEQRIFAKSYIDEIPFISFHDLWNIK